MNNEPIRVSPILTELRAATARQHRNLEQRLPFTDDSFDVPQYGRLIQAYYGFYSPLERVLAEPAQGIAALDWPRRIKAPVLRQDLLALGLNHSDIETLPRCCRLPTPHTRAEVLGVLYVLEGATLGGQVLRRVLGQKLGIEAGNGGAFLDVYAEATGALWRDFLLLLSSVEQPTDKHQAVACAQATFLCLENWLDLMEILR